jgi:hypothetical protein
LSSESVHHRNSRCRCVCPMALQRSSLSVRNGPSKAKPERYGNCAARAVALQMECSTGEPTQAVQQSHSPWTRVLFAEVTTRKRYPLLSELSRRLKCALVKRHLPAHSRVLEVGAGDGWFAERLRQCGHDVVTLDLAASADVARRRRHTGLAQPGFGREVFRCSDCAGGHRAR